MRFAWIIARKDLLERLRDRTVFIFGLVVPLGLAFIFNATLGGASSGFTFSFAVADEDGGPVAEAFVDVLEGMEAGGFAVLERAPAEEARRMATDDEVSAAFVIPAGFSAAIGEGGSATLEVVRNADAPIGTDVARALAEGFAAEVDAVQLAVATVIAEGGAVDPTALAAEAAATPSPVAIVDVAAEGGSLDFTTFYAIGIAVFFVFFTVQFGVLGIIEEREQGTMPRLLAAPIPSYAIVSGKLIAAFVVGVSSTAALWIGTSLIMGAHWGDPVGVVAMIVAGVLAAMGVGALVASFARTAEQANGYTSAAAVVLGILGGTFFPVDLTGGPLATLSIVTPHRWLMDGFRDLAAGDVLVDVVPEIGAVLVFALVTGAIGLSWAGRMVRVR